MKSSRLPFKSSQLEISSDLRFVDDAILLHNKVFNETGASQYSKKDEWLVRINDGGYFIVAGSGGAIKGFTVCDVTREGDFKIWLAGVDPEARGKGIWSKMYAEVIAHAKEKGYEYILLNTFPKKFPAMFSFLQKMNAEVYKEERVGDFNKVYTRIRI